MNSHILDFYRSFSTYTNPGLYKNLLKNLPDDVSELGNLVRSNIIHRTTLKFGNIWTNSDLKFGDMKKVPWFRQAEDDILVTTSAMLSELYFRDNRGFVLDRSEKDKLILTCRFVSLLMASILKSKGIPTRVRAGHAPYFPFSKFSIDHWINQYWSFDEKRWINIDVDGSWSISKNLDPYDLPKEKFDFPADAWLSIRSGKTDPNKFWNAFSKKGALVVFWSLFYDFHCLMNNEIIYLYGPSNGFGIPRKFASLSKSNLRQIDELAILMQSPDENFDDLRDFWNTNKDFRLLSGGLL